MAPPAALNLVVALPSEAAPLAVAFDLTAVSDTPLRLWQRDATRLVVAGVGQACAAAAVGWLAGRCGTRIGDVWLNVGIAGHRDLALGTVIAATAVRDAGGRFLHFPGPFINRELLGATVETHNVPVSDYPADACVDMEAAAFAAAALRFASADLVHSIKVVSDNASHSVARLDRVVVRALIDNAAEQVVAAADTLRQVAAELPADDSDSALAAHFAAARFSASERHAARQVYRRWRALTPDAAWPPAALQPGQDARAFLAAAEALLPDLPW